MSLRDLPFKPVGGQPAHVVVRLAAGKPRDGGVARAVDGPVDDVTAGDIHDAQHRLLGSTLGATLCQNA